MMKNPFIYTGKAFIRIITLPEGSSKVRLSQTTRQLYYENDNRSFFLNDVQGSLVVGIVESDLMKIIPVCDGKYPDYNLFSIEFTLDSIYKSYESLIESLGFDFKQSLSTVWVVVI